MTKYFYLAASSFALGTLIGEIISDQLFSQNNINLNILCLFIFILTILYIIKHYKMETNINNLPSKSDIDNMATLVKNDMCNYINNDFHFEQGFKKGVEYIYYKLSKNESI